MDDLQPAVTKEQWDSSKNDSFFKAIKKEEWKQIEKYFTNYDGLPITEDIYDCYCQPTLLHLIDKGASPTVMVIFFEYMERNNMKKEVFSGTGHYKTTPLHAAAIKGDRFVIKKILDLCLLHSFINVNVKNSLNQTPLDLVKLLHSDQPDLLKLFRDCEKVNSL